MDLDIGMNLDLDANINLLYLQLMLCSSPFTLLCTSRTHIIGRSPWDRLCSTPLLH